MNFYPSTTPKTESLMWNYLVWIETIITIGYILCLSRPQHKDSMASSSMHKENGSLLKENRLKVLCLGSINTEFDKSNFIKLWPIYCILTNNANTQVNRYHSFHFQGRHLWTRPRYSRCGSQNILHHNFSNTYENCYWTVSLELQFISSKGILDGVPKVRDKNLYIFFYPSSLSWIA